MRASRAARRSATRSFRWRSSSRRLAILDETDSGLDIDALKTVAGGINQLRRPDNAMILVTHYQRVLDYITPDRVHVFSGGRIVEIGRQGAGARARGPGIRGSRGGGPGRGAMTERITAQAFLAAFAALERRVGAATPAWLRDGRRAAIARFSALDLPTPRNEEWKYTSLAPLLATALDLVPEGPREDPAEEAVAPFLIGSPAWSRLVFVDGRYSAKLSSVRPLPQGAHLASLGEMLIIDGEAIRSRLATEVLDDAFAALNAAFWQDGGYLHIPAGVRLDEPVHLLFVATADGAARADHPRSLITLDPGSEATIVESHVALGPDAYLTNAMTDIIVGDNAGLDHCRIELESRRAFHVGRTQVRQARGSRFTSCAVSFGGRLARNDVHVVLAAEAATCALSGLFVIGGDQHVDTHTLVDHAAPRATSRQLYKGVLDGRARGVFNGRIIVRSGANGTDAHQTNKNLLLSDGVEVDSKPQLEIFADDVKCSHGAADGQVAPDAIFYLNSRGLDEGAARNLLTYGFANEVLGRIGVDPLRDWLEHRLLARLRDGRVPEDGAEPGADIPGHGEPCDGTTIGKETS